MGTRERARRVLLRPDVPPAAARGRRRRSRCWRSRSRWRGGTGPECVRRMRSATWAAWRSKTVASTTHARPEVRADRPEDRPLRRVVRLPQHPAPDLRHEDQMHAEGGRRRSGTCGCAGAARCPPRRAAAGSCSTPPGGTSPRSSWASRRRRSRPPPGGWGSTWASPASPRWTAGRSSPTPGPCADGSGGCGRRSGPCPASGRARPTGSGPGAGWPGCTPGSRTPGTTSCTSPARGCSARTRRCTSRAWPCRGASAWMVGVLPGAAGAALPVPFLETERRPAPGCTPHVAGLLSLTG